MRRLLTSRHDSPAPNDRRAVIARSTFIEDYASLLDVNRDGSPRQVFRRLNPTCTNKDALKSHHPIQRIKSLK